MGGNLQHVSLVNQQVIDQWIYGSPLLLVYAAAIVMALVRYERAPVACLLTIVGVTLQAAVGVLMPLVFSYFVNLRSTEQLSIDQLRSTYNIAQFIAAAVRGGGVALLVAAVFVGRPQAWDGDPYAR